MMNFLENIILDKKIREIDVASHLSVKKIQSFDELFRH